MAKQDVVVIDEKLATGLLPKREEGAHKWSVGGLVIVGGAPGYIGAPALCARAAMRAGAGIVSIAVSRGSIGPIASIVPEATFLPLPEGDATTAAARATKLIRERLDQSRALVVGPGLSDDDHAKALLGALFGFSGTQRGRSFGFGSSISSEEAASEEQAVGGSKPAVIDADGLNWLADQPEWWTRVTPGTLILTPHAGEMSRLLDKPAEEIVANAQATAVEAAKTWKQVVLLKGSPTVLTDGEKIQTGGTTPRSLATAGTGDVLAGAIGAFLAQGLSPLDAGTLAIFTGSRAVHAVERDFGTLGLLASDLPDAMARELARLDSPSST